MAGAASIGSRGTSEVARHLDLPKLAGSRLVRCGAVPNCNLREVVLYSQGIGSIGADEPLQALRVHSVGLCQTWACITRAVRCHRRLGQLPLSWKHSRAARWKDTQLMSRFKHCNDMHMRMASKYGSAIAAREKRSAAADNARKRYAEAALIANQVLADTDGTWRALGQLPLTWKHSRGIGSIGRTHS